MTRQEIEAGQWAQENSGKKKVQSAVIIQMQRKKEENASLIMVPSHMVNTDKNDGLK